MLENNKLICDFMNYPKSGVFYKIDVHNPETLNNKAHHEEQLHFHDDWNWIMPVWLKIMKFGVTEHGIQWQQEINEMGVTISTNRNNKYDFVVPALRGTVEVIDVYNICIDFISTYYNKLRLDPGFNDFHLEN